MRCVMFQVTIWDTRRRFETTNKAAVNKAIHQEFPGATKLRWIEQPELNTWAVSEGHGDPLASVKKI